MNRIICVMLLVLLTGMSAFAQIHLGVKGGLNISSVTFSEDIIKSSNITGYHIGPMLEIMSPIGIGIDAAVLFSQKGLGVKDEDVIRTNYLEIPVNFKLKMGPKMGKIYFIAGPYAEIRLSDEESKWAKLQADIKTKSFAAGVNLGLGLELLSRIQLGLQYGFGLTDNYSADKAGKAGDPISSNNSKASGSGSFENVSIRRKTISITATLLF